MSVLKMGTRGSALALAQSAQAAHALERLHPGLRIETVVIKTTGDMFGAPPPEVAKTLPQGAKGLWVKEIDLALLEGAIDFAVHSAKDLPARLTDGLSICAYPEREDPRDAFVAKSGLIWQEVKPGMKIATSSLRRRLMILAAKPGVEVVPLRGNVDTRLTKLNNGEFDAMVIAVAGLKRLGHAQMTQAPLSPLAMLPSPGQGALALEIRSDRREVAKIVSALDHASTRLCVEFERAFLAEVGGGCGSPVAAYAVDRGECGIEMDVFFAGDGHASGRRVGGRCEDSSRREEFVRDLAARLSSR